MLVFNSTHRLTEMAAAAARGEAVPRPIGVTPSWRDSSVGARVPVESVDMGDGAGQTLSRDDPAWSDLADLVSAAVVGEPSTLGTALTEDARGWSPTCSFSSRAEAVQMLSEGATPITPLHFEVECLIWGDPVVFAEWRLDATVADPILVADDLLVEAQGRPLTLAGATVAEVRQGRVAVVHTYFDEAALIEQVVLDR